MIFQYIIPAGTYEKGHTLTSYAVCPLFSRPLRVLRDVDDPPITSAPFTSAEHWAITDIRIGAESQFAIKPAALPFVTLFDLDTDLKMSLARPGTHIIFVLQCTSTYTQETRESFYLLGRVH